MSKIYKNMSDFERAWEKDFEEKVKKLNELKEEQNKEEYTCDGDWTLSTLRDDIYGEVKDILIKEGVAERLMCRAFRDKRLLNPEYMTDYIMEMINPIHVYNESFNRNKKSDKDENGIIYFDEAIQRVIEFIIRDNLCT